MSLRMTVQMDWLQHATYSRYHPDNLHKLIAPLPEPVTKAAPITKLTEIDKKVYKAWGHTLCAEKPYGPVETTVRIKDGVTPKIGSTWRATIDFERKAAISNTAMYGTSWREPSFEEQVEMRKAAL